MIRLVNTTATDLTLTITHHTTSSNHNLYLGIWDAATVSHLDSSTALGDLSCTASAVFFTCFPAGLSAGALQSPQEATMRVPRPRWAGMYIAQLVNDKCTTVSTSGQFDLESANLAGSYSPTAQLTAEVQQVRDTCVELTTHWCHRLTVHTDVGAPGDFVAIVRISPRVQHLETAWLDPLGRLRTRWIDIASISPSLKLSTHAPASLQLTTPALAGTYVAVLLSGVRVRSDTPWSGPSGVPSNWLRPIIAESVPFVARGGAPGWQNFSSVAPFGTISTHSTTVAVRGQREMTMLEVAVSRTTVGPKHGDYNVSKVAALETSTPINWNTVSTIAIPVWGLDLLHVWSYHLGHDLSEHIRFIVGIFTPRRLDTGLLAMRIIQLGATMHQEGYMTSKELAHAQYGTYAQDVYDFDKAYVFANHTSCRATSCSLVVDESRSFMAQARPLEYAIAVAEDRRQYFLLSARFLILPEEDRCTPPSYAPSQPPVAPPPQATSLAMFSGNPMAPSSIAHAEMPSAPPMVYPSSSSAPLTLGIALIGLLLFVALYMLHGMLMALRASIRLRRGACQFFAKLHRAIPKPLASSDEAGNTYPAEPSLQHAVELTNDNRHFVGSDSSHSHSDSSLEGMQVQSAQSTPRDLPTMCKSASTDATSHPVQLDAIVAQGGCATVWRGTWMHSTVAVKVFKQGPSARSVSKFRLEAEFLRTLRHPNICYFFDTCAIDGAPVLVFE